ncbi:hypothetical protein TWF730_007912 [Orbilia blumenaviensis]|uniref:Uncharacterized protein n=1 Tax=Orbilia blumenaviensis TaxID=1796055 RepID=A0AAV9VBT7_9PEZI
MGQQEHYSRYRKDIGGLPRFGLGVRMSGEYQRFDVLVALPLRQDRGLEGVGILIVSAVRAAGLQDKHFNQLRCISCLCGQWGCAEARTETGTILDGIFFALAHFWFLIVRHHM